MAPAITLGFGTASASDPPAGMENAKEQPTTQVQKQTQMPTRAQNEKGLETAEHAKQRHAKSRGTFLSSAPANSFGYEELIGAELQSRSTSDNVGEITDLVIGKDGQIAAVIVEVGGFLGLGEKAVAISWDAIERRANKDGEGHYFSVDTTKDDLNDATGYKTASMQY